MASSSPATESEARPNASQGSAFWRIWNRFGILLILLIFAIGLAVLTDRFLTEQNLLNLFRQSSFLAIISVGLLVVIITGNVDLTVGAFMGFSGALLARWAIDIGFLPALILVAFVALGYGLLNGFLATRGKGLSVIVTLAMFTILQGATLLYTEGRPISGFPDSMREFGRGYLGPIPIPVLVALTVAVVVHIMLRYTTLGRQLFAIGGNDEAARLSGIPVRWKTINAYVISAVCAAIAGLVLTARVSSAQPTAGIGDEFAAVGAVLIGGASLSGGSGSVIGTIAGVLILGMISNGLNLLQVNPFFQYIIKGLIILFAIMMDQWGRRR